jgi:lipopolysaccharide/colanic/teichoic acid biosynthesis glycosyltransferase
MAQQHTWQWPNRMVLLAEPLENSFYFKSKRFLDLILASTLLLLLLPLFLLIAVLIKLDSNGPVFFKQERVGAKRQRLGRRAIWVVRNFEIFKFRTMVENADPSIHEAYIRDFVAGRAQASPEIGGKFKLTNDPRITRVGGFLRKFSLDELPQVFNVLNDDMSLVGPRPVPPYEVACYGDGDHKRLAAMPGITGLWQVKGRCRVSFEGMVRMDLEYIKKACLLFDLKLILLTIPAVLSRRGAE